MNRGIGKKTHGLHNFLTWLPQHEDQKHLNKHIVAKLSTCARNLCDKNKQVLIITKSRQMPIEPLQGNDRGRGTNDAGINTGQGFVQRHGMQLDVLVLFR